MQRILNPNKALRSLRKTTALIGKTLDISQEEAETRRDGADGWSMLFIACHLRDYEIALAERVSLIRTRENPSFTAWDQLQLAELHAYADQELHTVLGDLRERRNALIAALETLDDAEWLRSGTHPQQGPGTLLDVVINASLHDLDHLEQLSRCA